MRPALQEKLAHLPARPGVYLHKDAAGQVLYVGKAKNLRQRVRSYFQESRPRDGRLEALVRKIADVEVIVTDTEAEALILENNLIKQLKPRYNINLRDDKTYPYICIAREHFPRVFPTRRVRKDGAKYFGPYTDVGHMHRLLRLIRSVFKVRTCKLNLSPEAIAAGKYQPCLEYHIKKCAAPCIGLQSEEAYNATIRQIEQLLNGKTQALIAQLRAEMHACAAALNFERAAELRDQIRLLTEHAERQKIISQDFADRDVFALAVDRTEGVACSVVFQVREGKVIGRRHQYLRRIEGQSDSALLQAFVEAYYAEAVFFPEEVLLSHPLEEPSALAALLRERRGQKVPLRLPQRGEKVGLVRLAEANAQLLLEEWRLAQQKRGEARIPEAVRALQEALQLPHLPRRIECFDISHLGGTGTVASCVVFEDGRPSKRDYRIFKIRSVPSGKPDDYQAMREVITRRYQRLRNEEGPWPDLVVIDGGKGQLSSALAALEALGLQNHFPIIGLAKRLEEIYRPGDPDPYQLPKTSLALQLLQRVRNEAHRFALATQRRQRKRVLRSELLDIPGIGLRTVEKLLQHFGSVQRVREASIEALAAVVGQTRAQRIRQHLDSLSPA
ncbi:UvrABC system protein C [bacterium HR18]|nr:UvrABC system protein C [bacterium HR18]